jgi:GT2 family glycosyltransferase
MRQGSREEYEPAQLIHQLNQRYRQEFDRAEHLQAELADIKSSRLWPWFSALRRLKGRIRRAIGSVSPGSPRHPRTGPGVTSRAGPIPRPMPGDELPSNFPAFQPQAGDPLTPAQVSIIIPFRNQYELLVRCLAPLERTVPAAELVLVDNGTDEHRTRQFLDTLRRHEHIQIIERPGPFNFSLLCNQGAAAARRTVLLFLNNDVIATAPGWLESMLEVAADSRVGVVGATLLYPNRTLQHAGVFASGPGSAWEHRYRHLPENHPGDQGELRRIRAVPAVTAACLLIRREVFDLLDGFDLNYPVDFNDVDLCLRARQAGYCVAITPFARLWHYESLSRGYQPAAA